RLGSSRSWRDVHACSAALSTPGRSSPAFPRAVGLVDVCCRACRAADSARSGQGAACPGTASAGHGPVRGGAPCLGCDVILPGRGRLCAHELCTGHSTLRPPAAPRLGVSPWAGLWGDLPHLWCLDAVDTWLS